MASEALCKYALDHHERKLSFCKNVVGLGIVPFAERGTKSRTRSFAVAVYVRKKLPIRDLAPNDVIPRELDVRRGNRIFKVPTQIVEQGEVRLESV